MSTFKKVLCIVDKYYPESSANTICADTIMEYFKTKNVKVDFLSIKYNIDSPDIEKIGESYAIKFDSCYTIFTKKHYKLLHVKEWVKLKPVYKKIIAVISKLKNLFKRNKIGSVLFDSINHKKILNLVKQTNNDYDAIVSISAPFGMNIVAKKLLEFYKNSKWYPIMLDPYEFNSTYDEKTLKKRKTIAQKTFKFAEKIFCTYGIKEEDIRNGYIANYHNKIKEITLPNLLDRTINNSFDKNKIVLTYAGMFYKDIRNPEMMLKILSSINGNLELNICGVGCEDIVQKWAPSFKYELNVLGQVEHKKCLEILKSSNILVNLSNTIVNQMPSKVLEYIGMGKPIINFYFSENDISLNYFKKYPLCLNINLNNFTDQDVLKVRDFCEEKKQTQISFIEATKQLVDERSDNVCDKIYKEVFNYYGDDFV